MNWGKGIVLGMIVFMLYIIGMSIYMFMAPADEYDHQYYEKGLTFNADYKKEKQVFNDHAQPQIAVAAGSVKLSFKAPVKGTISFIRQSDKTLDRKDKLDSGTGRDIEFGTSNFAKGRWRLVMDWQSDNKVYLYQQEIFIK